MATRKSAIDLDGLSYPSLGTRERKAESQEQRIARQSLITNHVKEILKLIGEDPERQGLKATPERYAKALLFFTQGYETNVDEIINNAIFEEQHDEMVIIKNIDIFSLCEHHMVPFTGTMSIGYIPNKQVIGLSKLARLADMFARRLQVQERMTRQIAQALMDTLQPQGVAVVIECSHLCMVMRGVQKAHSATTTSCMLGVFREDSKTREEFLTLSSRSR